MSRRGEWLPVVILLLLLIALPFLFQDPADSTETPVEMAQKEELVRQPREMDKNGQGNLPR
ncbi:MAG: hypothetical protein IH611_10135 [Deltaproteobacteria bacterium]|nr:hypothetical protein [Deltaproteobacteria bacterium]